MVAGILGVPWSEQGIGRFCPMFVNDRLTLDFDQVEGEMPIQHYCLRACADFDFDAILGRLQQRGIRYRSEPHGGVDMQVNTGLGRRIVYWSEPDGHVWEALTVGYARQPPGGAACLGPSGRPAE